MQRPIRVTPVVCSVLLLLFVSSAAIAADFAPATRAAKIAPFLDDEAILIGHVDLSRVDAQALIDQVIETIGLPREELPQAAEAQRILQYTIGRFTEAGCSELFVVLSLADVPSGGPYFIAPVSPVSDRDAIAKLLEAFRGGGRRHDWTTSQELESVVFAGPAAALERVKTLKAAPQLSLAQAFEAAGDTAGQILLVPSDDHRRAFREMLPELPQGVGRGDDVADGLQWAAVGIDTGPELSLRLVIQSDSAQSAAALQRILALSLEKIGQVNEVRQVVPALGQLSAVLVPKVQGDRLVLQLSRGDVAWGKLTAALAPPLAAAREAARRTQCSNNLKQLGIAMHNYHDRHKRFPAAASYDDNGKPLLSWRVHLLPYLDQQKLYEQFRLDQPWDSPHNRKLISKMPPLLACPSAEMRDKGMTTYLAPLGEGMVFDGRTGVEIRDIRDGTSNTIMIVDAEELHAVIWTKPDDLEIDPKHPFRGLAAQHEGGFQCVFCDGSVRFIAKGVDPKTLSLLFTRSDGQVVGPF